MPPDMTLVPASLLDELQALGERGDLHLSREGREHVARAARRRAMQKAALTASSAAPYWQTLPPSRVREVAQGASYWTSVDLLDLDMSGDALRAPLETFGVKVNRFPVGRGQHVVNVLSGEEATAPYVILAMHGDRNKLLLPTLYEKIAATERFNDCLTPEDLRSFVDLPGLPGRVVISLGCETGTPEMASAFLDSGCTAYIGPEGAPFGYASVFAPIFLFYELTERRSLEEAVERLRAHDAELAMWRLFT